MKTVNHKFPSSQHMGEITEKKAIVLHHTVSGKGVDGDINWWEQTKARVGTPIIIDREGNIHRLFSSKYWIHHLGIKRNTLRMSGTKMTNVDLNRQSIGVELDSWGGLVKRDDGHYYNAYKRRVDPNSVISYSTPIRGFYHYERYTVAQIEALRELLLYWGDYYNIDLTYREEMWQLSNEALGGAGGIWTHVSYRPDKSDCHPQNDLIAMLENL